MGGSEGGMKEKCVGCFTSGDLCVWVRGCEMV